jgi:hypothetical protein
VTKGPDRRKVFLKRIQDGEDVPCDEETSVRNEVRVFGQSLSL